MIIFSFAVLTLWLLCWVGWFFCAPGTKWFDKQMKYETYDFHGLPWLIFITAVSLVGAVFGVLYINGVVDPMVYILTSICSILSLGGWCVSFSMFALVEFHIKLRQKRNY